MKIYSVISIETDVESFSTREAAEQFLEVWKESGGDYAKIVESELDSMVNSSYKTCYHTYIDESGKVWQMDINEIVENRDSDYIADCLIGPNNVPYVRVTSYVSREHSMETAQRLKTW